MKKTISLISCVWLVLLFNTAQATIQTAEEVVMSTADAVLERLTAEREAIDADPGRIYGLVNEVVIPHFDFISMSKWVLGKKSWRGASEGQREQFIGEFRTLLVRTYAKALLEYSNEAIEYLPTEENPSLLVRSEWICSSSSLRRKFSSESRIRRLIRASLLSIEI